VDSYNHFNKLAQALPGVLSQVVRKTAFDGQGHIQEQIRANDQIDTGFMFNSVYVVTSEETTYKGGAEALPPVDKPENNQEAYVAVAAKYAQFPNYGTRFQPAKPFFEPGMEKTRKGFDQAIAAIEKKLKEASGS
jgi:HK97 gp10 family phage protein